MTFFKERPVKSDDGAGLDNLGWRFEFEVVKVRNWSRRPKPDQRAEKDSHAKSWNSRT